MSEEKCGRSSSFLHSRREDHVRFQQERPEQQKVGLQGRRENDRLRRQQETPEQNQERRLQAEQERQRLRRQQESLKQREQHKLTEKGDD